MSPPPGSTSSRASTRRDRGESSSQGRRIGKTTPSNRGYCLIRPAAGRVQIGARTSRTLPIGERPLAARNMWVFFQQCNRCLPFRLRQYAWAPG